MVVRILCAVLAGLLMVPVAAGTSGGTGPSDRPEPSGVAGTAKQPAGAAPAGSAARASADARAAGRRVAVTSEQAETRDVFANPDGSFTAELKTEPVRVRRGAGWVPVSTRLVRRADGTVGPVATARSVVFSGGGHQPLVRLNQGTREIALSWPAALPAPVLSGASATYREVFPGVDLRMRATAQGFSKVLVVKTRAAAAAPALAELRFGLTTKGLTARSDKHGAISFRGPDGQQVFGTGAPLMWDSASKRSLGTLRLAPGALVLAPDRKLLTDQTATFPLYIDPDFPAGRTGWAMVLSGIPNSAFWGGDSDRIAKVGLCPEAMNPGRECGDTNIRVARSYFQYDIAFLAGRHILSGTEFNAYLAYSPSCSPRPVQAWATNPVGTGTTWNNQPFPGGGPLGLGTRNVAKGYSGSCPGAWLGWDARQAVVNALTFNGTRATIMLKAQNEGDEYGWKKFGTAPTLSVTYNSYPDRPGGQTVEDRACAVQPNEPYVNPYVDTGASQGQPRGPKLSARITDVDKGSVQAQFEWYTRFGPRLGVAATELKASGSTFTVNVPAAHAADGAKLAYRVRGADGTDFGPWGAWCDVTIDRSPPADAPAVSSVTYPECLSPEPTGCPWGGGVGRTGGFTFDGRGDADVVGFRYGPHDQPSTYVAVGTGGTAAVLVTPDKDGPRDLAVRSVDRAGNLGPIYTYTYLVGRGTPPKGHWRLDGTTETLVVDDSPNQHDGTVPAGATGWRPGRQGDALWLNGATGHVSTTGGPTVTTNKSFAVSAWVKLDRLESDWRTAVSQDGNQLSGFFLQYNPNSGKWNFMIPAADADPAARRIAESAAPAVAGRWTHLVGMYDAAARQVRIYVDGTAGTPASHTTPWEAKGTVQLGRARSGAKPVDYWPGSLDEVRIYDRNLSVAEVEELAGTPAVEQLFLPLDENSGTTAFDASGNYRLGTLGGSSSWAAGKVGSGAARFDGGTATLTTGTPALRTDSSFTVTAWVRLDAADTRTQTVLSQAGNRASGFQLRYSGGTRKWSFALPQTDADSYQEVVVEPPVEAYAGEWTHLAAVYDAGARQIRLYVNSAPAGTVAATARWNANGAFEVGRGKQLGVPATPFAGDIDDVHVWTGVRTGDQITDETRSPVTSRRIVHGGQLSRYYNSAGFHIVTTGPVPPGSHFDTSLGVPAPEGTPNTRTVYSCRNGAADYFVSPDCGSHTKLGTVGQLYVTPPDGVETIAVYRCYLPGKWHFASTSPNCEGHTTEFLLGYTRAYAQLVRHLSTGWPWDHASSTGRLAANYAPEHSLGVLAMRAGPGTAPLMSCQDGTDTFTSTDPGCEGKTVLGRLGYLWTGPPDVGTGGAELFRCRASWGDLFDSRDPRCEGQSVDRSLGFVPTGL